MEKNDSPGYWAYRVIGNPSQQDSGQRYKGLERGKGHLSNSNASSLVATTKTYEGSKDPTSFIPGRHCNSRNSPSGRTPRLQPKPPSSTSLTSSKSITPRLTATRDISDHGSDDQNNHKSSRDSSHAQGPHSTVISEYTNELINHGQSASPKQTSSIARLSHASLNAAESRHSQRRVRRKSIDSRSFRSDDTNSVSSGYGSLPACHEEKIDCYPLKSKSCKHGQIESNPPLLRRRRNSFSASTREKPSRAEYLKAFNDSIRLRNARKVSVSQRPTTAKESLPEIATSNSRKWRKLRLLVHSAPVCGHRTNMDNGTNDSWEEFVALGMPVDDFIDNEKLSTSETMTPRSIKNITSSREHERILSEFRFNGDSSYRKDGAFKKSMMVISGGLKSMNMNNNGKSPRSSPRSKETAKSPDVNVVIEEEESECVLDEVDVHHDDGKSSSKIRSRGWKIVKARLSEIAEKAPKNGIDSTPLTFKNIAQLVKAKQFRMMLKRRASFMDNGRFQFDEAKQDLYARYKIDPVLVSKLTHTPRDSLAGQNGGAAKK